MENKRSKFLECISLFFVFLKIGLFTFGGGYAMISLLESEIVTKRKWLSSDEFIKIVAISESTPGPIAINCATYIGYVRAKFFGSVATTFGVVLPSFVIIYIISLFFDNLLEIDIINKAFNGIKAGVAVLILLSGIRMINQLEKKPFDMILFGLTIVVNFIILLFALKFSAIYLILIGGFCGWVLYMSHRFSKKNKAELQTLNSQNDEVDK